MNGWLIAARAGAWSFLLGAGMATSAFGQSPAIPDPVRAGQEIATRLRQAGPSKSVSFTGTMVVVRPNQTNQFPIASSIVVGKTNWQIEYVAGSGTARETLTIVHQPGSSNVYYCCEPLTTNRAPRPLSRAELFQPFAGSDFWRVDLGLDFFFWPQQRQIKNQMRRGRACRVLESQESAPTPGGYSRVVSWLDVETDGLLRAEAYDLQGQLRKEFLVGSYRKVNGEYHLEEITIRRPEGREETRIRFDLDRGEPGEPQDGAK
jgi:hypothetical protein